MSKKTERFEQELRPWLRRWVDDGIISESQSRAMWGSVQAAETISRSSGPAERVAQAIHALKGSPKKQEKKSVMGWLPALLIGLATVLLCVGVMLFYASNWRHMPPGFKLFQVFCLVLGTYGGSYYLLAVKQKAPRVGRALLFIGMVSFGAAISLVAQIFHISAHPSNGVLVWCLGTIAMSWVMKERWGSYLALVLCFIWTNWEWSIYHNANWFLPLVAALVMVLFVDLRERFGVLLTSLLLLTWVIVAEGFWLDRVIPYSQDAAMLVAFLFFPLGLCLIIIGRWLQGRPLYHWTSRVLTLLGWVAVMVPILGLSWPMTRSSAMQPFLEPHLSALAFQYMSLLGVSVLLLLWLHYQEYEITFVRWLLPVGLLFVLVPYGDIRVMMTFSHVLLLTFLFTFLYASYRYDEPYSLERFLAICFVLATMLVKYVGFTSLGVVKKYYFVSYVLGFVVFGTVCFLANQLVRLFLQKQDVGYPAWMISAFTGFLGYACFYSLTFKLGPQRSILDAKLYILVLLFVFIGLAALLYAFLLRYSPDAMILKLSGGAFLCTVAVMFLSGPRMPHAAYAITFNFMLFVMIGVLIAYSAQVNSKSLANFAILGFVLQMVTRYFDLLWNMLHGSLLFIVTGLLVLAGGYFLEKSRRRLLESIEQSERAGGAA